MDDIRKSAARYRGALFHVIGGLVIFLTWRIAGMPSPGILGRLLPATWLMTALFYGKGRENAASVSGLVGFVLLASIWTTSPMLFTVAAACALGALVPSWLRISGRRMGLPGAVLPLALLATILVPFTGDEPHYARITEELFPLGGERYQRYDSQAGDPEEGVRHHQSIFPALMVPFYPLGIPGLRLFNAAAAVAAAWLLGRVARREKIPGASALAFFSIFLVPGISTFALVYPGWLVLLLFMAGLSAWFARRNTVVVLAVAAAMILIKVRFVGLSFGMLAALVLEGGKRSRWKIPAILAVTALTALLFDLVFLGGRIFWVRYGNAAFLKTLVVRPLYRIPELITAAVSTLLDTEAGLLWKAPWVLAAIAGIPRLRKENPALFRWLGIPSISYLAVLLYWTGINWNGMPTPVGRMLLPMVPLLVLSLGKVMENRGTALLLIISLAVSSILVAEPVFRFNFADGTDELLLAAAGPDSGIWELVPSYVRPAMLPFILWGVSAVIVIRLISRNSRYATGAIALSAALLFVEGSAPRTTWEAEDLPEQYRDFCGFHPPRKDPEYRKYWMFTQERMLVMNHGESRVRIPIVDPEDTVVVEITCRIPPGEILGGMILSDGKWSDTLRGCSGLPDPPAWATSIREVRVEAKPENLSPLSFTAAVPPGEDFLTISPYVFADGKVSEVYLDRIKIRR